MELPRSAGILLHPTSVYTRYGIGDLGPDTFQFIEFLKASSQHFMQVLPIGPTGYADSPYQTISAFAGNPLLISPDGLIQMELITLEEVDQCLKEIKIHDEPSKNLKVNYQNVIDLKEKILKIAFKTFLQKQFQQNSKLNDSFVKFCEEQAYWLDDFVLFYSLKVANNLQSWITWPKNFALRHKNALKVWIAGHSRELKLYKFIQWIFSIQWTNLRDFAHKNNVEIIGDMPIFVAHDSVDVWANSDLFTLNPDGTLEYQAGVPPDYFSKTGQLWGNPLYKWEILQERNFKWFIQRFKRQIELFDWIRVDHFRGFQAFWRISGTAKDAIDGKWIKAPGEDLFIEVQKQLGILPIIAEDLGVITSEVEALRDKFNFPGMKILQFAFGSDEENPYLPHNFVHNCISYTGTHDNNTTLGWWQNDATKTEKKNLREYLNTKSENKSVVDDLIRILYRSIAKVAIIPIQDLLGQGEEARMNTPSVEGGNWQYQVKIDNDVKNRAKFLKKITKLYGRKVII
ncbi:4-alpha-glucanotransferase [Promethearchaeum syntrophicum]|uniref:4-alpha-glucanotransferase n=1 Tax=Promethearchaeum syntrophicum TaxID=2594042 RepID=A0A5B9D6L6_9ARCH|nr:4-alpha-glucanotransferase [Candidatus Prometheoarchaeum syntrophicum]QEE14682.1 4-alpha-glucanotransferase [Candidatus Prometheoarchaeum syntrophicum]